MTGRRRTWCAGVFTISLLSTAAAVAPGLPPAAAGATGATGPSGAAGPAGGRDPDTVGQWTQPFAESGRASTPAAVQAAVLADGRVFYFNGAQGGDGPEVAVAVPLTPPAADGEARILDLRSGTPQWRRAANDSGLLDSDVTSLPGGRVLVAGARRDSTRLFDPATDRLETAGPMHSDRSHAQMVVGPDGNPTVFGGAPRTETYRVGANAWEENYTGPQSETSLPPQPRVVLTPDGRFFYAAAGQMSGPAGRPPDEPQTALFQFFDPRHKAWSVSGLAPYGARSGAAVVPLPLEPPFDKMTLVTWGGVLGPVSPPGQPANPFTVLTAIDANGNVTNRNGKDLNHPRWSSSGVLLPDGRILAVGGTDRDDAFFPGVAAPVTIPELYDPTTDEWTEVAPHLRARGHHHSALLLPDMRVLLGGDDGDPSFEIWSPPYLFRGARPAVVRVQRGVGYGEPFAITTPDAALVESVLLLRTPSPGHGNDSDQRALKLEFTRRGATTLTATAPPSGTVAPPGTYYLVVNKKSLQGPIPSVARMVEVGRTDLSQAPQPFPDDAPAPAGGPTRAGSIDRRWISAVR